MNDIAAWFRRHLSNQQVTTLVLVLASIAAGLYLLGDHLAPVLAALVIAYLLQGLVTRLERRGVGHRLAADLVFALFFALMLLAFFGLMPPLVRQLKQLLTQVPTMLSQAQQALMHLPERYPDVVTSGQVEHFMNGLRAALGAAGQSLLSFSVLSVVTLITVAVYLVIVPFLVFFFLRDRAKIIAWFSRFLPHERELTQHVWWEVNRQIGNYVRGKVWEILIVGSVSYAAYALLGLEYALLLGALTGISVVIPYVGAVMAIVPIVLVGYFQWGLAPQFAWAVLAYLLIHGLDGYVLAPLLFSEVVDLHPVAIIIAILFFGGLWGVGGVFFAIPLATVIQAVIRAWPQLASEPAAKPPGEAAEHSAPVRAVGAGERRGA
jgi:putative permease